MDRGETFSIGFRTCNRSKNTGGEWIEYEQARKLVSPHSGKRHQHTSSPRELSKKPNHFENSTRNIVVLPHGDIVKVHLRLIRMFNNQLVA